MHDCTPSDIALKAMFLGPQSENADWFQAKIAEILSHTFSWRRTRFPSDGSAISVADMASPEFERLRATLDNELAGLLRALENETPKFTPRYIGHMVSEITLPALLAEFALLLHNPNNASQEAAKVGLAIEKRAIEDLARMIGFDVNLARGHFTSCGTIANFEALWRCLDWFDRKCALALCLIERAHKKPDDFFALCHLSYTEWETARREFAISEAELTSRSLLRQGPWGVPIDTILGYQFQGPIFLVPGNRHYSWPKSAAVFGLGTRNAWTIALDSDGRLDIEDLRLKIEKAKSERRPILCAISVAGTTELGEIDPISRVQAVLDDYDSSAKLNIWHHVDAAYGGFLASLRDTNESLLSSEIRDALHGLSRVDSVTIDPHKLGYIPYACGAFLTKDVHRYRSFQVEAPYLQAQVTGQAGWASTLEGSRSAAGAAAVWLTSKTLPLNSEGFGRILRKTIEAKRAFVNALSQLPNVHLVTPSDTNVLCFSLATTSDTLTQANARTLAVFEKIERGPKYSVSRTTLSRSNYAKMISRVCAEWGIPDDGVSDLVVIRLVLMNPFIVSKEMAVDFSADFAREIDGLVRESVVPPDDHAG